MKGSRSFVLKGLAASVMAISLAVDVLGQTDPTAQKAALVNEQPAPEGGPCSGTADSLLFPLNQGTWTVVPFSANGAQGSGPANPADPLQRNDDDFAQAGIGMPSVPFNFDLYGAIFTGNQIFINNNGNLSFGAGFSTFTATGFPINNFPMVAGFWADVDTRNAASGVVHYQFRDDDSSGTAEALVVTWDNVGYYNNQADKLNTFQIAISDGTNPIMGLGNNVCFSYDNMCWTTGSASGGTNGFGGTPATVGANKGDGVDFFQIGRFDHAGNDYDGPFGNADGVSFLDGQHTCFSSSTTNNNIAPIPVNFPPGNTASADAGLGETISLNLQFLSPEGNQTTDVAVADPDGAVAAGLVINNNSGNVAVVNLDWTPDCGDAGTYVLTFTATDNFNPPGVTVINLTLIISCSVTNNPPVCPTNVMVTLWPPNHAYHTLDLNVIGGAVDPDGDPITYTVDSITQDEPVNHRGDGNTSCDGTGVGTDVAQVRAERKGGGNGRVYHVNYTASDGQGGTCSSTVIVSVPHNQGSTAVDDGQDYDSTECFEDADPESNHLVDINDLLMVLEGWGQTGWDQYLNLPDADVTRDDTVDLNDLLAVLAAWSIGQ